MTNLAVTSKALFIHTIGCQMNVYDSEQIVTRLCAMGYEQVSAPEAADLIILNTCTIRAKAEQKAYSFLGRLARLKANRSDMIVAVGGCVAQQDGKKMLKRLPFVDIIFGTKAIDRLPAMIRIIESRRGPVVDIDLQDRKPSADFYTTGGRQTDVSRFVTIMRGCDNFCSYCVVPYVRGREISREPRKIIEEIKHLVDTGVKEVTLLGQNVNSYGKKEGLCSFAELLSDINDIEGLLRIRFTTSHPKDLNSDLVHCFGHLDKLCRHIHLPVQSGSNTVLNNMNRKYTRELYLDKVAKLRDTCPDIALTSDIIVGFPGETATDYEKTLELLRRVQFDGLFAFQYSDRPSARSVDFVNKISEVEKKERLQRLLAMQENITKKKNQALVGSVQTILVDGLSKKEIADRPQAERLPQQWTGRTTANKIVNFNHDPDAEVPDGIFPGRLLNVRIEKAYFHSLQGKPLTADTAGGDTKGAKCYAA
jgi:tRNA-2-methylthio-N6-dimethylallyladenosine synthase